MDREGPTARKRKLARERYARWRTRQSQETLNRMRVADNENHRRRREGETQEEREKGECIHQQQSQDIVNQSLYFCESQVETQHCGPMNAICEFCKAKNFLGEHP
ncbi:hypothetical protein AVEN_654-1 [Araneus ventricosus]|uniref:Uncharacterized protein n=1 Tax=Araneus ventricosus TaxID=182803 RepID=A0A4Y2BWK8_ARAVE|nr:hypothetical protein AVEN_654-1 [Araneus ventricosus]